MAAALSNGREYVPAMQQGKPPPGHASRTKAVATSGCIHGPPYGVENSCRYSICPRTTGSAFLPHPQIR